MKYKYGYQYICFPLDCLSSLSSPECHVLLPQGPNISKCFRWVATRERDADAVIMPCPSTSPSNPETIKTTCPYIQLDELSTENDIEVIFEQVYFWTG